MAVTHMPHILNQIVKGTAGAETFDACFHAGTTDGTLC